MRPPPDGSVTITRRDECVSPDRCLVVRRRSLLHPLPRRPRRRKAGAKAGITLAQYRQDALECGLKGYYTDISKTEDAKAVRQSASRQLDAMTTGAIGADARPESNGTGPTRPTTRSSWPRNMPTSQQHIVESVRPDERMQEHQEDADRQRPAVPGRRGYSKFVLTDDQRRALRKLKAGSDPRRAYLYNLASNPAVLQSQKAPAQP